MGNESARERNAEPRPWPEELGIRRQESLSAAMRNFEAAKQNLNNKDLESEALARFHLGVLMGISRDEGSRDEAVHEFEKVTVATFDVEIDRNRKAVKALRAQAYYNLAVLHHRKLAEMWHGGREDAELFKQVKHYYEEARKLSRSQGDEAGDSDKFKGDDEADPGDIKSLNTALNKAARHNDTPSWPGVNYATWIAARYGLLLLNLQYKKVVTRDAGVKSSTPAPDAVSSPPSQPSQQEVESLSGGSTQVSGESPPTAGSSGTRSGTTTTNNPEGAHEIKPKPKTLRERILGWFEAKRLTAGEPDDPTNTISSEMRSSLKSEESYEHPKKEPPSVSPEWL